MPTPTSFSPEPNQGRALAELRTAIVHEDMQEIISRPPSWVLLWGMSIMLFVTGGVLLAGYLVRYPDQLTLPLRFASAAPPVAVAASQPGRLRLLLAPNAPAIPGQALGYLESATSFAQARHLAEQLRALRAQLVAGTLPARQSLPQTAEYNQLGTLEAAFVAFKQAEAPALAGAPTPATTERLLQALDLLNSRLAEWQQAHVLTAPVAGRASYIAPLRDGQDVAAGQALFWVTPPRAATDLYGEATVAPEFSSKLRVAQPVLIEVDGYPAGEAGLVAGRLGTIAETAAPDGTRRITVLLTNGLQTDRQVRLPYYAGMQARANIIIGNPRLLQKVVAHFQ